MRAFAVLPLLATLALALPLPQTGEDSASSLKAALAHVENSNEAYISIAWAPEASYGDELGVDVDVKVKKDGAWVPHYEVRSRAHCHSCLALTYACRRIT